MIRRVGIEITTSAKVKGKAWAARYPRKADDLWIRAQHQGKRVRLYIGPPTPENIARAERKRAELDAAVDALRGAASGLGGPFFSEAAREYLRVGMKLHGLAESTQEDRRFQLADTGPLVTEFGMLPMESIDAARLLAWWERFIIEGGRTMKTGRNYLDAISGVYAHSIDRGLGVTNPADGLRAILRRSNRTKQARAQATPEPSPIASPATIERFVGVSEEWELRGRPRRKITQRERLQLGDVHVANLLMLDAGLREGEAFGLRWGRVFCGADPMDITRHLTIDDTLARGKYRGAPKSGRARQVAMSRRLRAVLLERYIQRGRPGPDVRVIVRRDTKRYRAQFCRVCAAAEIGDHAPKDLRDTFACHLLTAGISLGYIAEQLGHAHPQVTARHYARWVGEEYREPLELRAGEVPADLLARLEKSTGHQAATIGHQASSGDN